MKSTPTLLDRTSPGPKSSRNACQRPFRIFLQPNEPKLFHFCPPKIFVVAPPCIVALFKFISSKPINFCPNKKIKFHILCLVYIFIDLSKSLKSHPLFLLRYSAMYPIQNSWSFSSHEFGEWWLSPVIEFGRYLFWGTFKIK